MAQNLPFQKTLAGLNKLIETLESNIGGKNSFSSKKNEPEVKLISLFSSNKLLGT